MIINTIRRIIANIKSMGITEIWFMYGKR
jgi:2-iminoacetate synthase ThiH